MDQSTPAPATLLEFAKPAPLKPALLLSIVPFTAQNPVWFSSSKILTFAAAEELDTEVCEEELIADEFIGDEATDERMEDVIEEGTDDERREELIGTALDTATLDGADEVAPLHKLPVSAGISAVPPFFSTCTPMVALWPGCKLPFQLKLAAV
jgi:hypothetical protein